MGYVFRVSTEDDLVFWQWWGRYVMDLTDEEMAAAGPATPMIMRAAEAAWKASAIRPRRPGRTRRSGRKPTA